MGGTLGNARLGQKGGHHGVCALVTLVACLLPFVVFAHGFKTYACDVVEDALADMVYMSSRACKVPFIRHIHRGIQVTRGVRDRSQGLRTMILSNTTHDCKFHKIQDGTSDAHSYLPCMRNLRQTSFHRTSAPSTA